MAYLALQHSIILFPPITPQRVEELKTMNYNEYLQTPEWKERAKIMREHFNNKCQVCDSDEKPLEVHHRNYKRRGNENPIDLTVLCSECHTFFFNIKTHKSLLEIIINYSNKETLKLLLEIIMENEPFLEEIMNNVSPKTEDDIPF